MDVRRQQFQGIFHPFFVGAFVAVGCCHAGADKTVTNIVSSPKSCFYIRAIIGIDVHGVVQFMLFCQTDEGGGFVIQVPALDKSAGGNDGAWIQRDEVTGADVTLR